MPRPNKNKFNALQIAAAKAAFTASLKSQQLPVGEAADKIGVSTTTIQRWRHELGLPNSITVQARAALAARKLLCDLPGFGFKESQSVLSIPDLMAITGLKYSTIYRIQKDLGVLPFGAKFRKKSDQPGSPLMLRNKTWFIPLMQLCNNWKRPKGIDAHLEILRD